jgi:hypothetical protein
LIPPFLPIIAIDETPLYPLFSNEIPLYQIESFHDYILAFFLRGATKDTKIRILMESLN